MFDARYVAFAALAALLVISPGATLAVVVETALGHGRKAALLTVLGVGLANATLATATAFGLSALVDRAPAALHAVRLAGGCYLTFLGARGLWWAISATRTVVETEKGPGPFSGPSSFLARGVLTNLLNPPVILFYVTVVPQFIGPQDPYLARALVLGATHVAMSVVWQGSCGLAVGMTAEHMGRPVVRRTLEGITGAILVVLGARLLL
jgi:threonine/homoserine/homoserine lactone efflux protein